jgi:hypothetical protein
MLSRVCGPLAKMKRKYNIQCIYENSVMRHHHHPQAKKGYIQFLPQQATHKRSVGRLFLFLIYYILYRMVSWFIFRKCLSCFLTQCLFIFPIASSDTQPKHISVFRINLYPHTHSSWVCVFSAQFSEPRDNFCVCFPATKGSQRWP